MLEKLGIEEYLRKEEKLKEQEKFLILINDIFSNILEA
jgi:chromosome partitioning protein